MKSLHQERHSGAFRDRETTVKQNHETRIVKQVASDLHISYRMAIAFAMGFCLAVAVMP